MNIIFCTEPLNNKKTDPEWEQEYQFAKAHGMKIFHFDYEELRYKKDIDKALINVKKPFIKELCVYRGWMMPVESYAMLYQGLLERNLQLINNPTEYKHCYYLPESYDLIESITPKTVSIKAKNISLTQLKEILSTFNSTAIIIKDYVKSQKHHWFEACYIPNANDLGQAERIVNKFIELQGDNLEGGLVFRQFVELESVGIHPKSKMPLTMEYRIFILNGTPISIIKYWDDGNYTNSEIPIDQFTDIFKKIKSNFFTVDIAKLKNGDWVIIELGDGQVAEHMGTSGLDGFYQQLSAIEGQNHL